MRFACPARFPFSAAGLLRAAVFAFLAALALWTGAVPADAEPVRVVYGFDREFAPFTYEEEGGKPAGFEIELVDAVFQGTGAQVFHRPMPWSRVGLELGNGGINLTTGMVRTEQRARLYLFSEYPLFRLQIRLFTKLYNRRPSVDLLRGQSVSVQQGSYSDTLLEQYGGFNIKKFKSRAEAVRALHSDEVQAYCGPVQNTYFLINKQRYGAITTMGTPLGITEMRAAFNRSRGDIQSLFDEGLRRVVASGEYDRLYRKWFVRELNDREKDLMLRAATSAAVPAYVPYGRKGSGAAVLTASGKVYTACNMENADPLLHLSALRGAVAKAVSDGEFELRAALLTDPSGTPLTFSPEDLQVLSEFGRGVLILRGKAKDGLESVMLSQLLPNPVRRDVEGMQSHAEETH
ncbi:MAG: transporter substrate-binding domain-containing protein [Desulfovibrio sp.]|nr:transporter substrate-binding domain-containing protein [Desulfovibrio sp.]